MDIDRRSLLKATACLAMTGLAGPSEASTQAEANEIHTRGPFYFQMPSENFYLYRQPLIPSLGNYDSFPNRFCSDSLVANGGGSS